jgi:hypothetical protein
MYSASEGGDVPVRVSSMPEKPSSPVVPEVVAAPPTTIAQQPVPAEMVADASPTASKNGTGPALILTPSTALAAKPSAGSDNPLGSLAEAKNVAPATSAVRLLPVKVKASTDPEKAASHPKKEVTTTRSGLRPVQASKADKSGASLGSASSTSGRHLTQAEGNVNQRDVDIITAIVKEK